LVLPLLVGSLLAIVIAPLSWYVRNDGADSLRILVAILLMPLILALAIGKAFSRLDFWSSELSIPEFIAVRPLSTVDIIAVKIKVAAVTTVISWVLVLAFLAVWLPLWANLDSIAMLRGMLWQLHGHFVYPQYAIGVFGIIACMFLTDVLDRHLRWWQIARMMITLAVFILLGFPSAPAAPHAPMQPTDRTIRDLVDLALLAPPELAADVLLKLIEHGYITDAKWKRELLDTAWNLAPRATYTSEVAPAVDSAAASDTDSGSLSAALATGLSTAGLQARIISQMAKLDAPETRKLFLQMSVPAGESLRCSADRYTSHRPYFEALTVVAQTFSAEETKSAERLKFLADALRSLTNPEDFELSYPLVQSDQRTDEELKWLMTLWSESLTAAHFTDRLFSSRSIDDLANPILFGGKRAELRGVSMALATRALRSYFIRHARTRRCGESRSRTAEEEAVRTAFNKFAVATPSFETLVIDAVDVAAENFGETAKIVSYAGDDDRIRK
jgi:hypothetical protein